MTKNANVRATEIMQEVCREDMTHLAELMDLCYIQVKKQAKSSGYSESPVWDLDDLSIEAFAKVWQQSEKFNQEHGTFSTWFGVIVRNLYNDNYKRFVRPQYALVPDNDVDEDGCVHYVADFYVNSCSAETEFLKSAGEKRILDKLGVLPENQRRAMELCCIMGMKPADAAIVMGCTPDDISRWLFRAKKKLQKSISKETEEKDYEIF